MPSWLFEALKENAAVKQLDQHKGVLPLTSLIEEALVISASYQKKPRPMLVVKQNLYQAQRLYDRVSSLLPESCCALFGADESLRVEIIASSPETMAAKVDTLASLMENPNQIVITCPSGYLRQLPLPEKFGKGCFVLKTDDVMDMDDLKRRLIAGGYQQTSHIDHPLTFAARGGIVDVYTINYDDPVRIEFFDTEIESIRFFDVVSQKTKKVTDQVRIVPASDLLFDEEDIAEIRQKAVKILENREDKDLFGAVETDLITMESHVIDKGMYPYLALLDQTAGIWDYMDNPTIILSDAEKIREGIKKLNEDTIAYIQEMVQEKKLLPKFMLYHDPERIPCRKIEESPFAKNTAMIEEVHLPNETLDTKIRIAAKEKRVVIALGRKEMEMAAAACRESEIGYHMMGEEPDDGLQFAAFAMSEGFRLADEDLTVYTAKELFEIRHRTGRYEKKFASAELIHHYDELEKGDYVVHSQYGVGQYVGIETREVQGNTRDFLRVVYAGNSELLVPLEQFRLVRKFVSREGVVPKLNKLGTTEWQKTKKRLEKNVDNIAERLVALYADRREHIGHAFSKDNEMTVKFENAFPYELTPDQQKAVEAVKKDMESDLPMDRLICGDVGFGKTEVAVRASFKAVADGKQVAVLCPTTILAEQHFKTFTERYKGQPVTIRILDRFVTPLNQKLYIEEVKTGRADILIGTHRILSKDVVFKDLGLLVVDEEQRFGVEHKEKIKSLKSAIDVLTLSATPIPRTLQMSLVGIRSMSQLDTPPLNRYSVQTYVVEKNLGLIADAIQKEMARDGQVFYLHNNIDMIYNTARTIQNLVPEARVDVIHGRMNRTEIEDVMYRFVAHESDVLVCTTIVENGIDIPNVNTILVENAQDFGLAQMYQIKGRVGRSNRLAYAYLMIPERKNLSEVASKRLQAIKEFARLGSGYKIAMRDLTIRGAGDLLGANQSGFIDTVGIDMYVEMLDRAIKAKQEGKAIVREPEPPKPIQISKTSYIPAGFAANDYDKLELYQKIDALSSEEEIEDCRKDIIDQYGRLPDEVDALFMKKSLDLKLRDPVIFRYREEPDRCVVELTEEVSSNMDGVRLFEDLHRLKKDISLSYLKGRIQLYIPRNRRINYLVLTAKAIDVAKGAIKV
ncbi:MAG: transcription-repair coupling factor [Solobacterium sp.]|nr:transcription-repair coupling factor [Solobacterium sp.]